MPSSSTPKHREVVVPSAGLISQIPRLGDGFPTEELAAHWRPRGCGIACLRMVLTSFGVEHDSYWSLIEEGLNADAYCDRGWIHQGLVELAERRGVAGVSIRHADVDRLVGRLGRGDLVIASVTACFRGGQPEPEADGAPYAPGGHLVLVKGARFDGDRVLDLLVHHPSATEANNLADHWVSAERFTPSFSGNFMAFSPHHSG
ncbi:MAG: C39 family peptidase [Actinomycetota bacterium]